MEPWMFGLIGIVVAFAMLITVSFGAQTRDSVLITAPIDVVGTIRGWADHYYYVESVDGPVLRFKKGKGWWQAATLVDVTQTPRGIQIDAYLKLVGIGRSRAMSLTNSSFIGKLPRRKSLREFNDLLRALGHPPLYER